ncbi:hypothetical protein GCM10027030_01460 [Luteococcus sediminum]
MTFPVVTELAGDGVPVKLTCRVLGFSRQAYYQWLTDPVSDREWSDAHAANAVLDAHRDDPESWVSVPRRCAVKDVFYNRIMGYSIDLRMTSQLSVDALQMAVVRRGGKTSVAWCRVHSDRGSQFRARRCVETIRANGLVGSTGRVGAAGDKRLDPGLWTRGIQHGLEEAR